MHENLYNKIDIQSNNIYIPNGENRDEIKESKRYNKIIRKIGPINLQILGLGLNGHIGFNEPGTNVNLKTHKVKLKQSTIEANKIFFNDISEVPKYAYTMGIKSIMDADKILLLVSGGKKASILKTILEEEPCNKIPATLLNMHKDVTIIADKEALSEIDEKYFL